MENKKIDLSLYLKAKDEKEAYWKLANNVLYELCRKYPHHTKQDEVIAKMWLIGRSYAAAIERGVHKDSPYFYEDKVASVMSERFGKKIDESLNSLSPESGVGSIFSAYSLMLRCFKEISGKNNISLASKYLHFHKPDVFYIYDSRANGSIGKVVETLGLKSFSYKGETSSNYKDASVYVKFYLKCKSCVEGLQERYDEKKLSPREFDSLLLTIADMMGK